MKTGQNLSSKVIRKCGEADVDEIYEIINDAAQAYRGVIPEDMWHDPYMSKMALMQELQDGVVFWAMVEKDSLVGVMGMQDKGDVALIRHAYTKTDQRTKGIGSRLLKFLDRKTDKTILVGTWSDATWAISFYQKNGYKLIPEIEKNQLLHYYWNISDRQIQTSVVLAKR
jgi:N-acetylglutamate synthase-like GNAT family acetyltransferase